MNKQTIVIYGLDYWPDVTGIAPYTTKFAEYLAEHGDDVHVVAGMPYYPQWKVSPNYRRSLRRSEERNGVVIHRHRQYIPRKQSVFHRAIYEATFTANASIPSGLPKRPDLVIGVMPALGDGVLAARTAKKHDVPFTIWIQDLFGQAAIQSGMPGGRQIAKATIAFESWIVRQAASIAIVADGFRPVLENMDVEPGRIHHVPNWTHIEPPSMSAEEARTALDLPLDRTICLHAGNMGYKQGLENVVEAARIAVTGAPELYFVLLGDGNQRQQLEQLATGLPNLRFIDPVSNEMFPNALNAADILLINQRRSVRDMSLPSKLTSYFVAGKQVAAAVVEASETAIQIHTSGIGKVVPPDTPRSLVDCLHGMACWEETGSAPAIGRSFYYGSADKALTTLRDRLRVDASYEFL